MVWHGHEMLFGFTGAAIAGFLLTAVPNWTGLPTPRGAALGGLVALWLAGRLATLTDQVPMPVAAAVDLAFLPAVGAGIAFPLIRARRWTNLIFLPILGVLTVANALVWLPASRATGIELAVLAILLLIVLIGGRVIPFFTRAALPESPARTWPWVERLALASLPAIALAQAFSLPILPGLYLLAALVHTLRLAGWYDPRIWRVPLLWVLFAGYAWLPLGLALRSFASPLPALHALTAGCMGVLILGIMARVSLGHSGRPLVPSPWIALSFGLVTAAAALRSLGPLAAPSPLWVPASAVVWCLAFALYAVVYFPILTRPRADGKPG